MRKISLVFLIFILTIFIPNPANAIKIGLQTGVDRIGVGSSNATSLIDANTNKTIVKIDAMKGYEIVPYKNTMAIRLDGKFYQIYSDNIVLKPAEGGFISAKNKWYRGHLIIQNKNKKLTVINDVSLEDYIKGVVPSEMPSGWELEALKAQAIAARSYALANLGKRAGLGFDLKDTPEDQAYGGASAEKSNTNDAVSETEGIVLVCQGKIVPAYYSASAGGKTRTGGQVWSADLPFLKSVPSFDEGIKKNGHGVGMSQYGANNLAKRGYNAYQILKYFYANTKFARVRGEY